jgi:N,N'-diacetyllegionaminate synthase
MDNSDMTPTIARTLVIAEAGVNHNGDLERARRMVDVAAQAGADIVKFQTFRAERLASGAAPKAGYQLETTDAQQSQRDMLRALELRAEDHADLARRCRDRGITFLSTPFDEESVDLLVSIGVGAFKIPSGEITNHRLLRKIAAQGKDVVLSTGMSFLGEVERAVQVFDEVWGRSSTRPQLTLLHCVTNYPAAPAEVNLRAMETMRRAFGLAVGYSDHTMGIEIPLAAVALGACLIEKHFTLDRTLPGPDHRASLEPDELTAMIRGIRAVEAALGDGIKRPAPSEASGRQVIRKSLIARRALAAGHRLGPEDLDIKRPGTGIAPDQLPLVLGLTLTRPVAADAVITWDDLKRS